MSAIFKTGTISFFCYNIMACEHASYSEFNKMQTLHNTSFIKVTTTMLRVLYPAFWLDWQAIIWKGNKKKPDTAPHALLPHQTKSLNYTSKTCQPALVNNEVFCVCSLYTCSPQHNTLSDSSTSWILLGPEIVHQNSFMIYNATAPNEEMYGHITMWSQKHLAL